MRAIALAVAFVVLAPTGQAQAAPDVKKALWGPADAATFLHYRDLGVGIYQYPLFWSAVAPTRPSDPTNPNDPAYKWPVELDAAIALAEQYGIKVSIEVIFAPPWSNGGRAHNWSPTDPSDYAKFLKAASRRYRYAQFWQIWGEPSRQRSFSPMPIVHSDRQLTTEEKRGPKRYARLLNAGYWAIKEIQSSDLVIGGNTLTRGDVRPLRFIQAMRLPNGRPPRMDLYGHNPFSPRKPDLSKPPFARAAADFCDLDTLAGWIDSYLGRTREGRRIRIFIAEYTLPSDHSNYLFPWWGSRQDQADYLRAGLRITRNYARVYTFGWYAMYDQDPVHAPPGQEVEWGLMTQPGGTKKPSYYAYKNN